LQTANEDIAVYIRRSSRKLSWGRKEVEEEIQEKITKPIEVETPKTFEDEN
jgi:hypothetical protein